MKGLILSVLIQGGLIAQSVSVTSPSSSQTISGTSFMFTSTLSSLPSAYSVEYDVNGEPACITRAAPYSCGWNTTYVWNNPYNQVVAIARDALNNTLATSSAVPFVVNNVNWPESSAVCTMSVATGTSPTSTWTGNNISLSLTGTGSNCTNVSTSTQIDGQSPNLNHIDTTAFDNGMHTVVFTMQDGNLTTQNTHIVGQWEYQINFQNSTTAMELRANKKEVWLCTTTQTNCPTTFTLSALVYNTDETTTAASGLTYSSGNTAVAMVNSSGVVTAVAVGSTQITVTDASGRTVLPWVHVNTQNLIGSFGSDGAFHTTYVPGVSLWITDTFNSQSGFNDPNLPAYANFGASYANIFNTYEVGIWCQPLVCGGTSQSAWQSAQNAYVSSIQAQALAYGLYYIGIGDSAVRQTSDLWKTTRSVAATVWSPPAATYAASSWIGTRLLGMRMFDEGNTIWGSYPLAAQLTLGSALMPGPIACTTSTCTVTGHGDALSNGGGGGFIIRGATTNIGLNSTPAVVTATESGGSVTGYTISNAGSGYNASLQPVTVAFSGGGCASYPSATATVSATGTISAITGTGGSGCTSAPTVILTNVSGYAPPVYFVGSNPTSSSFTFANPGLGAITVTSSTDPGLVIEPFATILGWFDSQGNNPPATSPASDYVRYNAFSTFVSQWRASGSHYPLLSWGVAAAYGHTAIQNWIGDPNISNFATLYISPGQDYLPQYNALFTNIQTIGFAFRDKYSVLGANRINEPIMGESSGTNLDYGLQGYPIPITSISGNLITFAAPHGIYNVLPNNTRLWISSSTNSAFNTNFYVMDCPTVTTCHVALSQASFSTDIIPSVTGTFSNGDTFPAFELSTSDQKFPYFSNTSENSTCTAYHTNNHRGQTVTFAGTGVGGFAGITWWYVPYPLSPNCDGSGSSRGAIYPLPTGTSTGGTATIVQSQAYTHGINYVGPGYSEQGPRTLFNANIYYAILPAAGITAYQWQGYYDDARSHDHPAAFQETGNLSIQTGINAYYLQYGNQLEWITLGHANKLLQRLAPMLFGQNMNAPDLGRFIECGARTAAVGNYLGCASFSDGPALTRAIDLSNCAVSGQAIEKFVASWRGIAISTLAAGTTSDTFTFLPDTAAFVAYACWRNVAANYAPTVLSARLEDVPNAAKIVVQYGYLPDPFQQPLINQSMLFQSFDCGSGTCTLPVDRNIGSVYYRLVYLDSQGRLLATSDVQQM